MNAARAYAGANTTAWWRDKLQRLLPLLPWLVPLILLLSSPTAFPYPPGESPFSDLAISHYPNAVYLRQALAQWRQVPLWSPLLLGGYPFFADPLSGLYYPPGWLALIMPVTIAFHLLAALHVVWGGVGLSMLLCKEGMRREAALFAGLAFALLPKLYAHWGAGHLTLLYAVPWTPWLLLATRGFGESRVTIWRNIFQPGVVLAVIFFADARWAAYAGILWLAYAAYLRCRLSQVVQQLGLAVLLSAPLALPLLEYTKLSTRAALTAKDFFTLSLPPASLFGLVFPAVGGNHEWALYGGASVLALALLSVLEKSSRHRSRFWLAAFLASMFFALGEALPGSGVIAAIPGASLLRVPARSLFISGLALVACSGYGLDRLLSGSSLSQKRKENLALTSLSVFAAVFGLVAWRFTDRTSPGFLAGAASVPLASAWLAAGKRLRPQLWIAGLVVLTLVDLGWVDRASFRLVPEERALAAGKQAAQFFTIQPGIFRVYSPSYSLPQQTAARYRVELAGGVDPLSLRAYADFFDQASGVRSPGYSVSLPAFATGQPLVDNAAAIPDSAALGLLNVRYVLSAFDLQVEGLNKVGNFGSDRLYRNEQSLPRAWTQTEDAAPGIGAVPFEEIDWRPNSIGIRVKASDNARLLVLSEIAYPGWHARVDGKPAPVETVAGVLRGVHLEAEAREVVLTFVPASLVMGLALFALGCALLTLSAFRKAHRS